MSNTKVSWINRASSAIKATTHNLVSAVNNAARFVVEKVRVVARTRVARVLVRMAKYVGALLLVTAAVATVFAAPLAALSVTAGVVATFALGNSVALAAPHGSFTQRGLLFTGRVIATIAKVAFWAFSAVAMAAVIATSLMTPSGIIALGICGWYFYATESWSDAKTPKEREAAVASMRMANMAAFTHDMFRLVNSTRHAAA